MRKAERNKVHRIDITCTRKLRTEGIIPFLKSKRGSIFNWDLKLLGTCLEFGWESLGSSVGVFFFAFNVPNKLLSMGVLLCFVLIQGTGKSFPLMFFFPQIFLILF